MGINDNQMVFLQATRVTNRKAIELAIDLIAMLNTDELRETLIGKKLSNGKMFNERTEIIFLVRDFDIDGLGEKERYLEDLCKKTEKMFPKTSISVKIKESYRNMKLILDKHPQVVEYAMEAVNRTGLKPIKNLIRGGTDGARLCFMDLPTPNVFTGGHNFHSKKEWISVQNMAKAVETIVHFSQIWAEKNKP